MGAIDQNGTGLDTWLQTDRPVVEFINPSKVVRQC